MILSLPVILFLAWVAAAENKIQIIQVSQGQNVSLPCTAGSKPGVEYRACRWYKEGVGPRLTGLVSRTPPGGTLRWYVDADMRISLEYPSLSLLLPPVSCSDSGVYQCYLAAPVGEQNREGRVRLSVTDCPVEVEKTPAMPEVDLNQPEWLVLVAGLLLVVVLGISLICLCLRKAKWSKAKSMEKALYPDLSYPLDKRGLILPNFILSHNSNPSASKFSIV